MCFFLPVLITSWWQKHAADTHLLRCPLHVLDALVGFTSETLISCFNDPLSFIVYSNGPVFSCMVHHIINGPCWVMHPWWKIRSISFVIFLLSCLEAAEHDARLPVLTSSQSIHLLCSPHMSPPSLLVFIFLLPRGVILSDITPPSGQMLKLKHAIHQPTDIWVAQQICAMTQQRRFWMEVYTHTHNVHTHSRASVPGAVWPFYS